MKKERRQKIFDRDLKGHKNMKRFTKTKNIMLEKYLFLLIKYLKHTIENLT